MDYLQEKLGARQVSGDSNKGKVQFKLFFPNIMDPNIESIQVAGSFQKQLGHNKNWDFENGLHLSQTINSEGTIWSLTIDKALTKGFYEYKYYVTFKGAENDKRKITDPFARYGGIDNENAGVVIGGSKSSDNIVSPLLSGRKPYRDLVIYELMIDDFTDEFRAEKAPIDAVRNKLDYLKDLGINAILFMPWNAWKGNKFNWGYDPYMYFSVEYRYVTNLKKPCEKISYLKKLIDECHKRDIHVIMDGVFNHVSPSFPYRDFYHDREKCPYAGKFDGAFPGLQDLNFNNICTQEFIRDVCLYWIQTFKIDGIRFDNTVNFHIKGDERGLPRLINSIQDYLDNNNETNFSFTLEHMEMDAVEVTKSTKATSYWDNEMHEKCFNYLWHSHIGSTILNSFNNNRFLIGSGKVPTTYIANHDHSHVAWQAGARDNVGSMNWYKTQPHVIALLTSPGTAMIQNGQEFAEDQWIVENDHGSSRRVQPRPLRWGYAGDKFGSTLYEIYKKLIGFRNKYNALRSDNFYPESCDEWQTTLNNEGYGVDLEKQIVVYHRWGHDNNGTLQRFIIALNFSDREQIVQVPFSANGKWRDILNDTPYFIHNYKMTLPISSYWGRIFLEGA
ncbi:alpha-amylase family glycosyl hydrolase [Thermodesulfobacteriota bacterium]